MKATWIRYDKAQLIEQLEKVVEHLKSEQEAYKEAYSVRIVQLSWFRKLFYNDIYDVEYHEVKGKQYDYYDARTLLNKVKDCFENGAESVTLSKEEVELIFSYIER